ncbi:MAG TPA: TIGR02281 family clan AA aspartic protease [Caulobacteraceae bacterium]|nr:TIGR02281 family clan AA aspartic protease [Caulobacteraceae bacterium]
MLRRLLIVLLAVASAALAARVVANLDAGRRAAAREPAAAIARIPRADDGHYWANGEVGGRRVRFLVDTGATNVSLTPDDARHIGIDVAALAYEKEVITARGRARAAPVTLASLAVGGAKVEDVEALVIRDGLEASLLGMSYLGRLERFEVRAATLVLEP